MGSEDAALTALMNESAGACPRKAFSLIPHPFWLGEGWICVDTCAYGGMFLTALDVDNDLVYQARQTGEFRGPISLAASTEPV
jgi:hypothetical protein